MRFLHTADWHLGRTFYGASLLDDQAHVLDQIVALVHDSNLDAVIVAGDIYDRSVPPADAVSLLDDVLERIVIGEGVPTIMIAGNHDSSVRLSFGSRFLAGGGFHVFGPLESAAEPVVLSDVAGTVHFCPLPYTDPARVRLYLDDDSLHDHDSATRQLAARARTRVPDGVRAVAIAHCWVVGGTSSESERPLTVGGSGQVAVDCFTGFAYTALGHLHRPQSLGADIEYSGSLLKYSFSEVDHRKCVNLVDLDASGAVAVERVALTPRRDVRIIEGELRELLRGPADDESAEDYLLVRLTDRKAILDAMGKLRQVYPNVLHIERPGPQVGEDAGLSGRDHLSRTELELFEAFHEEVMGFGLENEEKKVFLEVVESVRMEQREGNA